MNNQTANNTSNNVAIIPNVAVKIKDLSNLNKTYLKLIIQLFPLLRDPVLERYASPLVHLLQNLVNIHKNDILSALNDALTNVFVSYIFDMDDLIKGRFDAEYDWEPRYQILYDAIDHVDFCVKHGNYVGLDALKEYLFAIK